MQGAQCAQRALLCWPAPCFVCLGLGSLSPSTQTTSRRWSVEPGCARRDALWPTPLPCGWLVPYLGGPCMARGALRVGLAALVRVARLLQLVRAKPSMNLALPRTPAYPGHRRRSGKQAASRSRGYKCSRTGGSKPDGCVCSSARSLARLRGCVPCGTAASAPASAPASTLRPRPRLPPPAAPLLRVGVRAPAWRCARPLQPTFRHTSPRAYVCGLECALAPDLRPLSAG